MSDRERRKIQQQERLFEQLEYDEQHKGKRGKRNSAGSTLNTPGLSSSVRRFSRPLLFDANTDEQKQLGHPESSHSTRYPREHSHGVARKTSGNSTKTNGRPAPKPKPVYVDNSTQTGDDKSVVAPASSSTTKTRVIRRPMSLTKKLLQQAAEDRQYRDRNRSASASVKAEARSPALKDVTSNKPSPAPSPPVEESAMHVTASTELAAMVTGKETIPAKEPTPAPSPDVEMQDADEATSPRPLSPKSEEIPDASNMESSSANSHTSTQLPPPPWPPTSSTQIATPVLPTTTNADSPKPVDLHVQLPPSEFTNPTASTNSAVTPGSVSGTVIAQSPIGMPSAPSPFSPSVTSAVTPGPARKKLSLSDYTSRRAKLAQTHSTGSNATPPLGQSQSIGSPTLSTSSLPNQGSPSARTPEPSGLPTVTEEPKAPQSTTTD